MGWLVGLPLGIFRMIGVLILTLIRLAVPIILIVVLVMLYRRSKGMHTGPRPKKSKPDFKGPVYTVDYEVVDEEESDQTDTKDGETPS